MNVLLSKILSKLLIAIVIVALADLVYLNWWVIKGQNLDLEGEAREESRVVEIEPSPSLLPSGFSDTVVTDDGEDVNPDEAGERVVIVGQLRQGTRWHLGH